MTLHPEKMKTIANKLEHIAINIDAPPPPNDRRVRSFGDAETVIKLTGECIDDYESIVNILLGDSSWRSKLSEAFIESYLNPAVVQTVRERTPAIAAEQVEGIARIFDAYNLRHQVYIPIAGLQLDASVFDIGNVRLHQMDDQGISTIFRAFEAVMASNRAYSQEEQLSILAEVEGMLGTLKGFVCAEFDVNAEPIRAQERAYEEVRRVIDLLYYCRPYLYPTAMNVAVGLQGEVLSTRRVVPILSKDSNNVSINVAILGPKRLFQINFDTIARMDALGLTTLSNILKDEHPTDFDNCLVRAVHWVANSQLQTENENTLLSLMTALEVFFSSGTGSIANTVANGSARLLTYQVASRAQNNS